MGRSHHVGVDLAPEVGPGAAADDDDRTERLLGEALDDLQQPAAVVGDALQDRPEHVGPGVGQRQVGPPAPDGVVVDRGALAVEPRQVDQPAAARRRGGRDLVELLEVPHQLQPVAGVEEAAAGRSRARWRGSTSRAGRRGARPCCCGCRCACRGGGSSATTTCPGRGGARSRGRRRSRRPRRGRRRCRSTTGRSAGRPQASATSGRSVPMIDAESTSGGSLAWSMPLQREQLGVVADVLAVAVVGEPVASPTQSWDDTGSAGEAEG